MHKPSQTKERVIGCLFLLLMARNYTGKHLCNMQTRSRLKKAPHIGIDMVQTVGEECMAANNA